MSGAHPNLGASGTAVGDGGRLPWRRGSSAIPTPYNREQSRVSSAGRNFQHQPRGPGSSTGFRRGISCESDTRPINRVFSTRGSILTIPRGGSTLPTSGRGIGPCGGNRGRGLGRGNQNGRGYGTNVVAAKLTDLIIQDPDEVIIFFVAKEKAFDELLQSEFQGTAGKEQLICLVHILGKKLCGPSNLTQQRNPLVAKCCQLSFLNHLKDFLLDLSEHPPSRINSRFSATDEKVQIVDSSPVKVLWNFYNFAKFVTDKMPSQASDQFLQMARNVSLVIPVLKAKASTSDQSYTEEDCEELAGKFSELKNVLQEYKTRREEAIRSVGSTAKSQRVLAAMERRWREPPPNDFRSIPDIPTVEELLADGRSVFLRASLSQGKYPSAQDYLDTQFRLLREDFVDPLREGLKDYFLIKDGKKQMSAGTVKVYKNVQLLPRLNFDSHTPHYEMKLDYANNRKLRTVKWNKSKRLLPQSLILLSKDNFKTIYFATICKRDETQLQNEGKFGITWEGKRPSFSIESYFDVIECDVYFEAYRHTLATLKKIEIEDFPMSKYILDADTTHRIPSYIQQVDKLVDFKMLMPADAEGTADGGEYGMANISDTDTWPSAEELGMDESQYQAFSAALTREISIIQGPPGTGKTFIAIQIAKFLLANRKVFFPEVNTGEHANSIHRRLVDLKLQDDEDENDEGEDEGFTGYPVLVVCYTNHALDQFLEAVAKIMREMKMNPKDHLVRVGFQTKSDEMKELLMHKRFKEAESSERLPYSFRENLRRTRGHLSSLKRERFGLISSLRLLKESASLLDLKWYFDQLGNSRLFLTESEDSFLSFLQGLSSSIFHSAESRDSLLERNFGIYPNDFYNPDFTSYKWMNRVFGQRGRVELRPTAVNEKSKQVKLEEVAETDTEDQEDFDLEELMANRIQEIEFELDTEIQTTKREEPHYLASLYIHPFAPRSSFLNELRMYIDQEEAKKKPREEESMDLMQARFTLSEEILMTRQLNDTIKDVVRRHNEKSLTLPEITAEELDSTAKLSEGPPPPQREVWKTWAIYFQLLEKCKKETMKEIFKLEEELVTVHEKFKEVENSCYAQILKHAKFVGMTTTGAAKYNSLLPVMQSRLVIVEEAAEVLESHIMTCITKHCEHLILIGDHKQLRPKTAVYKLAQNYNLDVSLFERMINNDLNLYRLAVQHRMRPEICKLIVPTIYDSLENHESVSVYPPVLGVESNMFFISHKEAELEEEDSTSKSNKHEAQFLVRLCRHFLLQGYAAERITILTTYIGQMFLIKSIIRKESPTCQGVRVTVVDNFQGEENDIILLSLVRSNEENKIGFLKTENRICVALSRAKHGFFVVGNMDSMTASSQTWMKIVEILRNQHQIGPQLFLKCQIHGEIIPAAHATDFDRAPEGGCSRMCNATLDKCGHICRLICHVTDIDHVEYQCRLPCEKKCEKYGHPCPALCYQSCPRCMVKVNTLLGCGHSLDLACCIDVETFACPVVVSKTLPCQHIIPMLCHDDPSKVACREVVEKELPCGHSQRDKCSARVEDILCLTKISVVIPACSHPLEIMCYQKTVPTSWTCKIGCDTRLLCGHACVMKCHAERDADHENYKCQKDCARTCENGHKCGAHLEEHQHNHKCHSKCPPCEVIVNKELLCGHKSSVQCALAVDETHVVQCEVMTKKKSIDCPHEIPVACYQIAAKFRCMEPIVSDKKSPCGHCVEVPCNMEVKATAEDLLNFCQVPCVGKLYDEDDKIGCEHHCQGTCSKCFRGRLHQKCGMKCEKALVCGHICKHPCSAVCPPCKEMCDFRCTHSKCKAKCGTPCTPCKEPCDSSCQHSRCTKRCGEMCNRPPCDVPCKMLLKCGHPCVGLCSEPCPKLCRICDEEELSAFFFGTEDAPDARFLMLEECEHVFEVSGLDKWILEGSGSDRRSEAINVKKCPKCSKTIRNSRRYRNALKSANSDVIKVKTKIFGKANETTAELITIAKNLEEQMKSPNPNPAFFFALYMAKRIYRQGSNPFLPQKDGKSKKTYYDRVIKSMDQFELESMKNMVVWCREAVTNLRAAISTTAELPSADTPRGGDRSRFRTQPTPTTSASSQQSAARKRFISPTYRMDLEKKYVQLLTEVTLRTLPLSRMEVKQFSMEFQRLSDLFQLYRRYSVEEFEKFNVKWKCEEIKTLVLDAQIYNKSVQQKFEDLIKEVDGMMKLSLPQVRRETVMAIYTALGSEGSWYKCPNDHIYLIGNCGNPSETSKCLDCKATVGASAYHVSAAGNVRVAPHRQLPPTTDLLPAPDFLQ